MQLDFRGRADPPVFWREHGEAPSPARTETPLMASEDPKPNPNAPFLEKAGVIAATWLVPGLGYWLKRKADWRLFLANFLVLEGVFLFGLLVFRSPVVMPEFNRASPEFSFINILIFAGQLLNGGLGLFSTLDYNFPWSRHWLGGAPEAWQADLGSFYMVVAGALNFFVMTGVYDRYYAAPFALNDKLAESGAPAKAAPQTAKTGASAR
jgi:hypothetical protein